MTNPAQASTSTLRSSLPMTLFALALLCAMTMSTPQPAQAQTFTVLHIFTDRGDGAFPSGGLILDAAGNLYGAALDGGYFGGSWCTTGPWHGCGTVFELTHRGSGWILNPLYSFVGGNDGQGPGGSLVFGPNGVLYGTTGYGGDVLADGCSGDGPGCGTVFSLSPPSHACSSVLCPWTQTVLYRFLGGSDGALPNGSLVVDAAGNLYGTTFEGGPDNEGTVFELSPTEGGGWAEQTLHSFTGAQDGGTPYAGLIFDAAGNLYGTTWGGGTYDFGTVFELTPTEGGGWTEQVLYSFNDNDNNGTNPIGGLVFDAAGNLYGTTYRGGSPYSTGAVFELSPTQGGGWTEQVIYAFPRTGVRGTYLRGANPASDLIFDAAGNLYGTTSAGGTDNAGTVFELSPTQGGGWMEQVLHSFNENNNGGVNPYAGLILDAAGNLYGTAEGPGAGNYGTVFELRP